MLGRYPMQSRKQKHGQSLFNLYQDYDYKHGILRQATSEELKGKGLLSEILKKKDFIRTGFNVIADITNRYPGERHLPLYIKDKKKIELANFAGPGTHVLERLHKGPPESVPKSKVDEISKAHDLRMMTAKNYADVLKAHNIMLRELDNASKTKSDSFVNIKVAKVGIKAAKLGEKLGLVAKDQWSNLEGIDQFNESDQRLILTELEKLQMKGLGLKDILKVLGKNKTVLYIKNHIIPSLFNALGLRHIHPDLIHQITHFVYKLSKTGTRLSIPTLAQKLSNTILPLMIYSSHITHKDQLEGSGIIEDLSKYGHILFNPYRGMAAESIEFLKTSMFGGIRALLNQFKKLRGGAGHGIDLHSEVGYKGITGSGFWDSLKKAFYKIVHSKVVKVASTVVALASPILAPEIAIPAGIIKYLGEHWKSKRYSGGRYKNYPMKKMNYTGGRYKNYPKGKMNYTGGRYKNYPMKNMNYQ